VVGADGGDRAALSKALHPYPLKTMLRVIWATAIETAELFSFVRPALSHDFALSF